MFFPYQSKLYTVLFTYIQFISRSPPCNDTPKSNLHQVHKNNRTLLCDATASPEVPSFQDQASLSIHLPLILMGSHIFHHLNWCGQEIETLHLSSFSIPWSCNMCHFSAGRSPFSAWLLSYPEWSELANVLSFVLKQWKVKVLVAQSCLTPCNPHQAPQSVEFSRQEYWSG